MVEWRRETEVLTKRGSRETKDRMTQLAIWKRQDPATIHSSSVRLLKNISNKTETNHRIKVAKKKAPTLFFSFWFWLLVLAIISRHYHNSVCVVWSGGEREREGERQIFSEVRNIYIFTHGSEVFIYFCSSGITRGRQKGMLKIA